MNDFYLIGVTGNLGSGKSTVRGMLEEFGARGIDADQIARTVTHPGSRTWFAIVREFGLSVLKLNGELDRRKLAARVFANPDALKRLEEITHPAVGAQIREQLHAIHDGVVVIEAVKLIEAGLHKWCDQVWIVKCDPEIQLERVSRTLKLRPSEARARLKAQGSINEKLKFANVVIDNGSSKERTHQQVQRAWDAVRTQPARDKTQWLYGTPLPSSSAEPTPVPNPSLPTKRQPTPPQPVTRLPAPASPGQAEFEVRRARKSDLDALDIAFARRENRRKPLARAETLSRFGSRGYRIALADEKIAAFVAWDAENLVAVAREAWAESASAASHALPRLFAIVEEEAKQLHCEVLLLLVDPLSPPFVTEQAKRSKFQPRNLQELHPIWRQVVFDRIKAEDEIWVKRLREQLVSQPC